MNNQSKTLLTLDERLALAAGSIASSHEAAVKMVERLADMYPAVVFCSNKDLYTMIDFIGEFLNDPSLDLDHYRGLVKSFEMAIENHERFSKKVPTWGAPSKRTPAWGANVSNALALLGFMMLDHTKARAERRGKDVYFCTQMTLGQYLDAIEELSVGSDKHRIEQFKRLKEALSKYCDPSLPLAGAMTAIMRRYLSAWREMDEIDHIIHCSLSLGCAFSDVIDVGDFLDMRAAGFRYSSNLGDRKIAKPDMTERDIRSFYLKLANSYNVCLPDPEEGPVREMVLRDRNYDRWALDQIIKTSPDPRMSELLAESLREERVASALDEISAVVKDIYMLWVEPYLHIIK